MRLIDADALRKSFKKSPFFTEVYLYYARQLIDNAPTIESRAVGEWVHDANGVYCSNCKSYYETITYWNGDIHVHNDIFCGHCGAKMIKEDPRKSD